MRYFFITWKEAGDAVLMIMAIGSGVFGIFAAVYTYYTKNWKPQIKKLVYVIEQWPVFFESHKELELQVQQIKHQVFPNGGSSIADKLNFLVTGQEVMNGKQRAIIANDTTPMFITNNKGDLEYVNHAWLKITGFTSPEEAYGLGWMQAIPEADKDKTMHLHEQQEKSPSNFYGVVTFKNVQTGELTKTIVRTTIVKDRDGKLVEKIGSLQIL